MPKKASRAGRSKNASKLQALIRSQQINELLKRSTIESEALQSSGDDRPIGEQHIGDLLEPDSTERRSLHLARTGHARRIVRRSPHPKRHVKLGSASGKKKRRR